MRPEQHPASNSNARKAHAEAANPHEGCDLGTCKAQDQWRRVSCAGGGGDVEAAWETFDRATPAVFWDVATWVRGGNYVTGSLDVADRKRIVLALLAAQPAAPQPTEGGELTEAEREELRSTWPMEAFSSPDAMFATVERILAARSQRPEADVAAVEWVLIEHRLGVKGLPRMCACGYPIPVGDTEALHRAHLAAALLAAQRPEGVTVTEWRAALPGEERPGSTIRLSSPSDALEMARRWGATAQTRQRTTYPDVVTEWAEVSGDTEAGGDRG